ncbi:AAA family ATPase [Lachnospiraceae bacterium C1.1]|nr:AAA family ATPase [Lachnospiraceae bacterium C1.1]
MRKTVGLGIQDFENLIDDDVFYIDKTRFISEWWNSKDNVTLITRPRRFGKTLMLSTVEKFFSVRQENSRKLFNGLQVSEEPETMKECGQWPVLFISFANVKSMNFKSALKQFNFIFWDIVTNLSFLKESLDEEDLKVYKSISPDMNSELASNCIGAFCKWLSKFYGKKVIILLDEYDTPMQEAYVSGYWNEIVGFMRNIFNGAFKTNPYLHKALLTGITRVSRESLFSDLNNINVVTSSSEEYSDCFGFTEKEVFNALDTYEMSSEKNDVKKWYDGFKFGKRDGIYNPWSIISFLKKKKYEPYWANTSSNSLISKLVREGNAEIKQSFERLLRGECISTQIDEQLVYGEMQDNETAVWSLLQATGYLKIADISKDGFKDVYELKLTNFEILRIFGKMVLQWFSGEGSTLYNEFVKSLLKAETRGINKFLNKFLLKTCSYFDGSKNASTANPERFYHGLVLGLMIDLDSKYILKSNRESGYGRYDIMLIPKDINKDIGIIIEFKVLDEEDDEKRLEDTAESALKQIEQRHYDEELLTAGVPAERIFKYGFAFSGKEALVLQSKRV